MEHTIEFNDEISINSVCFEDKNLFSKYVYNMQCLCEGSFSGDDGICITDENMDEQNKQCLMLWDLYNIPLNDKKILTAISKHVENELDIGNEEYKCLSQYYQLSINIIQKVLVELPFDVNIREIFSLTDYIKFLSLKVVDDTSITLLEKVLKLIEVIGFAKNYKLLVFVNLRTYFNKQELIEIYKYARYNDLYILSLESGINERAVSYEHVLCIDKDYEEFLL